MYISNTIKPDAAKYATAAYNVDGRELLKDGYGMFMLDGRNWRRFVEILRDEDGCSGLRNHRAYAMRFRLTSRLSC